MKTSPLTNKHEKLGARMVPFAGWEMPIQYEGIVAEHRAVREGLGIFDISHMANFEARGAGAGAWLNGLLTNDIFALADGRGQYTLMLDGQGGVLDDLIVYRLAGDRFFLVLNASRAKEDWAWLEGRLPESEGKAGPVSLVDRSEEFGAVAVQGPRASSAWEKLDPGAALPPRNGIAAFGGAGGSGECLVCRTGYTGEDGFELFAPKEGIGEWFDRFLGEGGAVPCGLGARDTLRLEKCYPLYGNDLDREHSPLEAGLGWCVKLDKEDGFTGSEALREQKRAGLPRRLAALRACGKTPPFRSGYPVEDGEGAELGQLSSGGLSPTLGVPVGLAYLPPDRAKPGTRLAVSVRGRAFPVEVVKKPFV